MFQTFLTGVLLPLAIVRVMIKWAALLLQVSFYPGQEDTEIKTLTNLTLGSVIISTSTIYFCRQSAKEGGQQ